MSNIHPEPMGKTPPLGLRAPAARARLPKSRPLPGPDAQIALSQPAKTSSSALASSRTVPVVLALTDLAALLLSILLAGAAAWFTSEYILGEQYVGWSARTLSNHLVVWAGLGSGLILWFIMRDAYSTRRPLHTDLKILFQALAMLVLLDGFTEYARKEDFSRLWVVAVLPIALIVMPLARIGVRRVLDRLGLWRISAIVIGGGEHRTSVAQSLSDDRYLGYRIASERPLDQFSQGTILEVAGKLERELGHARASTAILVPTPQEILMLGDLMDALNLRMIPYVMVPPLQRLPLAGLTIHTVLNSDAILMTAHSGLLSPLRQHTKRLFDIVLALVLIVLLLPVFLVLGILIERDGARAVFGHRRIGKDGKPFQCLKLRTMVANSDDVLRNLLERDPAAREEWQQNFKLKNDPRITRLGRFLRASSLDELPQVFNVLMGEMSFVGPRPVLMEELERYYGDDALYYKLVRPGVTGLWQVNGRSSTTYERRVHLDAWYVRNWNLWLDIRILLTTIPSVLAQRGAR